MKELRQAFHAVLNQLNKITVQTGALIEQSKLEDSGFKDDKEQLKKAMETLVTAEQAALKAGEIMADLKKKVYELLKIDTSKPIE